MSRKLSTWLVASTFLFFIGGFSLGLLFSQSPNDETRHLLVMINDKQQDLVKDVDFKLSAWGADVKQHQGTASSPCDSDIIKKIGEDPRFTTYVVADVSGDVICTENSGDGSGVNLSDRPYFQEVLETKKLAVSGFLVGRFTGSNVMVYAHPVLDDREQVTQVLLVGMDLSWVNDFFSNLDIPRGSEIAISDLNGNIEVYYPNHSEYIGQQMFEPQIFSILLSHQSGDILTKGIDGKMRRYIYGPVYLNEDDRADSFVLVGLPKKIIFNSPYLLSIALVLVSLTAILIQLIVVKRILKKN